MCKVISALLLIVNDIGVMPVLLHIAADNVFPTFCQLSAVTKSTEIVSVSPIGPGSDIRFALFSRLHTICFLALSTD